MGMKSHDYHILFQQILPLCIWHRMNKVPPKTIIRICKVFKRICTKVNDPNHIPRVENQGCEFILPFQKGIFSNFFQLDDTINYTFS